MRFTFVSSMSAVAWGGSEELWSQAALRLRQQGHEVSVSVVWWPNLSPKILALKEQGIKLFIRRPPYHSVMPVRIWHKLKRRFRLEEETVKWLRQQKPDLVIISQGNNSDGLEWMKFCDELNLPFVTIVHCNSETWWPRDDAAGELAAVYLAARQVFCVSNHNRLLLEYQIGGFLPNAKVIWATVTWNPQNEPDSPPPDWPEENFIWKLACIARLDPPAKGQDVLLQVLAQTDWRQKPVELNLYGEGPFKNGLMRLAQRLGLQNVHFCDRVTHVKEVWQKNHLLVMPSRFEGLPAVLVEAMWCERPSVVTNVGGNAELCVDGQTGFIVPAPTVELFSETLHRAWERRSEWRSMGKAARTRVEKIIPKDPVADFCGQLMEYARPVTIPSKN